MVDPSPLLIYDDDCGICTRAVKWIARRDAIELRGFSVLDDDEIERLPDGWRRCAHLLVDDEIYSCGEAMERAYLLTDPRLGGVLRAAGRLPGYSRLREFGYRHFANNRGLVARLVNR